MGSASAMELCESIANVDAYVDGYVSDALVHNTILKERGRKVTSFTLDFKLLRLLFVF